MKLKTIIGILVMGGFGALLLLNFGEQVGGYMNFDEAAQSGAKAHVVGQWVQPQQASYDRTSNIFSFYMADDQGNVRQVQYANPKPASFDDAEKVVVEGYLKDDVFVAEHILLKCPSKYNDERSLQQTEEASL